MRVWVMVGVVSALVALGAPAAAAEGALFEGSMSIEGRRPAPGDGGGVVDCAIVVPCVATANDGNVSQLTFRAGADFNKQVAISPVATSPGECGGADCVTAYNVQFADGTNGAVAEITVVMSKAHSTPPGHAAVFIDGAAVTARCEASVEASPIPCAKITSTGSGQTRYFVRFDADPAFKFR
jgi:hypothetical protein